MDKEKIKNLRNELLVKHFLLFLREGIKKIVGCKRYMWVLVSICGSILLWRIWHALHTVGHITAGAIIEAALITMVVIVVWALISAVPKGSFVINHRMARTELMNSLGERPVLIKREIRDPYEIWTFDTYAVGLSRFQDHIESIEAALDVAISAIYPGDKGHQVNVELMYHPGPWPSLLPWSPKRVSDKPSELLLGENRGIPIRHDLAVSPHLFICSRTGGGKSSLLKTIMMEGLYKGWIIKLIDYKRAVDYSQTWKQHVEVVTNDDDTLSLLDELKHVMNERLALLEGEPATNIDEYNRIHNTALPRILLVFDEVGECLNKTGADKQRKDFIDAANRQLTSLCSLSRAANISVVLSTQRGGADLLTGGIRANIYSICGIADSVLSVMCLGNGDADKRIPKNARGCFLTEEGIMFQGYYIQEGEDVFPSMDFELVDF